MIYHRFADRFFRFAVDWLEEDDLLLVVPDPLAD